jgi:hypothetical protein
MDQARIRQRHLGTSSFHGKQPSRLVEMCWRITGITSMTGSRQIRAGLRLTICGTKVGGRSGSTPMASEETAS